MRDALAFAGCPPGFGSVPFGAPPPPSQALPPPAVIARRARAAAISLPVELRIQLPFLLREVRLVGARVLPEHVIMDAMRPLLGRRVSRGRVWKALRAGDKWLAEQGYVASRVAVATWPARPNGNALVVTTVDAVLAEVRLQALTKDNEVDMTTSVRTSPRTVARALGIKVGDIFRWYPQNFNRIMHLGIFEFARAELEPINFQEVVVIVSVRERGTSRIEPGAGINSDGRMYGDISVLDDNFLGRAQRLRIEWQRRLGMGRAAGGLEFQDPRVGAAIPLSYRIRAFRRASASRSLPGGGDRDGTMAHMDRDRDGLMFDLSWRPERMPLLVLSGGPVLERIHSLSGISGARPDNQALLMFSARHFASDPSPLPRFGHRVTAEYGTGRKVKLHTRRPPTREPSEGDVFHRLTTRFSQYFALGSKGSVAIGGSFGTGSANLPPHEQTPLGGPSSVRGYSYGEIGRASSFATGRIEVRYPFVEPQAEQEQPPDEPAATKPERKPVAAASSNGETEISRVVITKDSMVNGKVQEPSVDEDPQSNKFRFPKLPHLAGVLFADTASKDLHLARCSGSSYGIGLRVAGFLTVEYTYTWAGEKPRLHFGMVDRDL
jgi:hypothetical protein